MIYGFAQEWRGSFWTLGVLLGVFLAGCSTTSTQVKKSVAQVAEEDYKAAMEDLLSGNYTEAMLTFQKVSKAPRYVRWSALAKLRIADSLFFSGKYLEAGQEYEGFILQHQGDPNEAHAQFGLAMCQIELIPSDMWLLPPPYEREREPLNRARVELETFLQRFSQDRRFDRAHRELKRVKDLQFEFVNYVAGYYESRGEPAAVIVRGEYALRAFPERSVAQKMDLRLAKAYLEKDRIRDALRLYEVHLQNGYSKGSATEREVEQWRKDLERIVAEKESGENEKDSGSPAP